MKKNRTMRAAVLMLALTLITSCFVGSTFAKYTTGISGSDTARVAKFGVELTADANLFGVSYNESGSVTVISDDNDVIAPGTAGTATFFTISGKPEVDVTVAVNLGSITMVTLPAGNYKDYTNFNNATPYTLAADYKPVKWTLMFKATGAADFAEITNSSSKKLTNVNLDVIDAYLRNELSKNYNADGDEFDAINGQYKLSWSWGYDTTDDATSDDKADTYLGNLAAGIAGIVTPAGYVANEYFALTITVTQID